METKPVERHGKIVALMAKRIVEGVYATDEILPNVEELAEEFAASRTVIREGLKVLSAKGFVQAKRRTGTRVLPKSAWSLMDRDVLGWLFQNADDLEFGRSLLQLRHIVEPEAAALAAEHASAADLADLERAYHVMRDSLPHDVERCCAADVEFHTAVLRASGNMLLEQLAHSISFALLTLFRMTTRLADSHAQALRSHGELIDAIRARRPGDSRRAAQEILGIANNRLETSRSAVRDADAIPNIIRSDTRTNTRPRKPGTRDET